MKILIISGHGAGDSGACGCGYKEADLTRKAASILEGKLDAYDCKIVRYPSARNCYEDNKRGEMQDSFSKYGLVVEIHFNSYNGSAHGCECLYRPARMRSLAAKVSKAISEEGFFNRGAKQRTDLMNMNTCYRNGVPYILIETCFIDSKADMARYAKSIYEVWGNVAHAICKYYGIEKLASAGKPVETTKTSTAKKKPAKTKKKTVTEVAKEVIDGKWGNDPTRSKKLKAAGYDPVAVQKKVNALLK
jgi:N-acetylmuramoyl-L-alanine amidase